MKFEIGKMYKIRDGRKAQIFMLNNGTGSMFGAIDTESYWTPCAWLTSGCFKDSKTENLSDIVSEWSEPKKMKKVALFVRKNHQGEIVIGDYMQTEERAKEVCVNTSHALIKWPYGEILEVEDV